MRGKTMRKQEKRELRAIAQDIFFLVSQLGTAKEYGDKVQYTNLLNSQVDKLRKLANSGK